MVLIGCPHDSHWHVALQNAILPLGRLKVITKEDALAGKVNGSYEIIAVDATSVADVEQVVSSLRTERPERRIVVMTARPNWEQARAAFEAGAIDYLPKNSTAEELLKTFKEIRRKQPPPWPR